jgi:hypothetical protein
MFDRGVLSIDDVCEVFNRAPVPGGDKRYIRKEYAEINRLEEAETNEVVQEPLSEEPAAEPEEVKNAGEE